MVHETGMQTASTHHHHLHQHRWHNRCSWICVLCVCSAWITHGSQMTAEHNIPLKCDAACGRLCGPLTLCYVWKEMELSWSQKELTLDNTAGCWCWENQSEHLKRRKECKANAHLDVCSQMLTKVLQTFVHWYGVTCTHTHPHSWITEYNDGITDTDTHTWIAVYNDGIMDKLSVTILTT